SLAFAWNRPALGVHHLEGHLLAPMLDEQPPDFPFLALLVSGGHTLLAEVRALGDYEIIAHRWMTLPGKPLTRPPRSWVWTIPVGRRWRGWPGRAGPDTTSFRAPCWIALVWISASVV